MRKNKIFVRALASMLIVVSTGAVVADSLIYCEPLYLAYSRENGALFCKMLHMQTFYNIL